jgi:cell division septal protein FtsQ
MSRKRKKIKVHFSIKSQLILFIILGTIYTAFFSNYFKVQEVIILESNKLSSDNLIQRITLDLKNQNILLLKKDTISTRIKNHYPQIKNLHIKKRLPQTIQIHYDKFKNLAFLEQTELETSYFTINETGVITKSQEKPIELPQIILQGLKLEEGMQIVTPQKLTFIVDSINLLKKDLNTDVKNILYLPKAQEIHLILNNNTQIWLDMTFDHKEQINKLKFSKPHINLANYYQYIDLRIKSAKGHKIFYKE